MKNKVVELGLGKAVEGMMKFAGPAGTAVGIMNSLANIKKADDKLAIAEHDAGVAATANKQNMKSKSTDYHHVIRESVARVKEGGSDLSKTYGAQATKILQAADMDKSNLDSDFNDKKIDTAKKNLYSGLMSDKQNLMKQQDYQITQGIGNMTQAQSGLLTELQKNVKLQGDIEDQRDQLTGITNIAGTIAGGLV